MTKKNSIFKSFLSYLLILIINVFITLIAVLFFLNMIVTSTPIQENNIIKEKCEENILWQIERIAYNVSGSHEYKFNEFDCTEFSLTLVQELKKINVSSYCVFGLIKETSYPLHVWVQLIIENKTYNIEATSGEFILESEYQKKYKEIKRGLCL